MSEVTFPLRGATRTNLPVLHIGRTHVLGKFMIIEIYETYSGRMEVFEMESGRMEVFEFESGRIEVREMESERIDFCELENNKTYK